MSDVLEFKVKWRPRDQIALRVIVRELVESYGRGGRNRAASESGNDAGTVTRFLGGARISSESANQFAAWAKRLWKPKAGANSNNQPEKIAHDAA